MLIRGLFDWLAIFCGLGVFFLGPVCCLIDWRFGKNDCLNDLSAGLGDCFWLTACFGWLPVGWLPCVLVDCLACLTACFC